MKELSRSLHFFPDIFFPTLITNYWFQLYHLRGKIQFPPCFLVNRIFVKFRGCDNFFEQGFFLFCQKLDYSYWNPTCCYLLTPSILFLDCQYQLHHLSQMRIAREYQHSVVTAVINLRINFLLMLSLFEFGNFVKFYCGIKKI